MLEILSSWGFLFGSHLPFSIHSKKGMSSSGTTLPNSHLTWNKPITPSSHWRTPRPRYFHSTFSLDFILFLYFCALFPWFLKDSFTSILLKTVMFLLPFFRSMLWKWEWRKWRKHTSKWKSTRLRWDISGFYKNMSKFLKESRWMCDRKGTEKGLNIEPAYY